MPHGLPFLAGSAVPYRFLADAVLMLHLVFIFFVIFGALLLLRYPRLIWLHLPAVLWGAAIEFNNWLCPLTPLENHFRALGSELPYAGDFIAHYLMPLVYPATLTRGMQLLLGIGCLALNALIYALLYWKKWRRTGERKEATEKEKET